jgi:hypothetical protein
MAQLGNIGAVLSVKRLCRRTMSNSEKISAAVAAQGELLPQACRWCLPADVVLSNQHKILIAADKILSKTAK